MVNKIKRGRPKKSVAQTAAYKTVAQQIALNTQTTDKGYKYILDNYDPLPRDKEKTATVEELVLHNFRYMFTAFKKFLVNIPISEYCSEIYAALYDAAQRFNRKKDIKFITFAQAYVNLYLLNYARKRENIITFTPSAINKIKSIQKFIYNYADDHDGAKPSKEVLMKEFALTEQAYIKYHYYCNSFLVNSLDEVIYEQDNSNSTSGQKARGDFISQGDVVDQEEEETVKLYEKDELMKIIQEKLSSFTKEEQKIIEMVFTEDASMRAVSREIGWSPKKTTERYNRIMRSLRTACQV